MTGRQAAGIAAKLAFAGAIVWWLMHKVDGGRVWTHIREAERAPIVLGFLLCLSTVLVAGWRWQRLLAAIDLPVRLSATVAIAQIGQFFMVFLPGPTGDDLTRMLYISRIAQGRIGEACTTVLLDRLIGLASVLGLALLCIPWQWALMATTRQTYWLACGMVAAGALVCGGGLVFFALPRAKLMVLRDWALGFLGDGKVQRQFRRMGELLVLNRRPVARVIAAALGTQLILCLVYWLAGHAVGMNAPLSLWMSFVPIVLAANAVPITIAGLGVREYLLVLFLGVVGHIAGDKALAASLVVFGVTLAACLFGGIVYIFYRPAGEGINAEGRMQKAECRRQNEEGRMKIVEPAFSQAPHSAFCILPLFPMKLAERIFAGVAFAVLLWLMAVLCGNAGALWRDEVGSANLAQLPTWSEMWGSVAADSFPPFFNTVLRVWIMIGGASDDWFHYWGFVPVLGIAAALAWSTRTRLAALPVLSGALLLFNPTMFYWGTSLRAYGPAALLVILLFGTVWRVIERPTTWLVALGVVLSICNAQATYQNATPVFAICVSGALVAVLRRQWRHAALALGIGLAGALSLLIHYRSIQEVSEWNILIRQELAAWWFVQRAADAFGSGGWGFLWLWGVLVLGVGALAIWHWSLAKGAAAEGEDFRGSLYACVCIVVASVVCLLFNTHVGYPTQEWYYIPFVALVACAVEFALAPLLTDPRVRLGRLIVAAGAAVACLMPLWSRAQVRRTNIDLIVDRLRAEAVPGDLILVSPFYCGMSFDYYYRGSVPWQTIPPMGHKETYNSYKYVMPHVRTNEPLGPLLEQIGSTLRSGGKLWFVGGVRIPPDGTRPPVSPPAPHPQFGWSDEMYSQIWGLQVGYFVKLHATNARVVPVPVGKPVQRFEELQLVEIAGWRP